MRGLSKFGGALTVRSPSAPWISSILLVTLTAVAGAATLLVSEVKLGWVAFTVCIACGVAVFLGFAWPRSEKVLPRRFVLICLLLIVSPLMPSAISASIQGIALVWGLLEWWHTDSDQRAPFLCVLASCAIIGYWALLIAHPNVPSVEVGLLGFRKSVLAVPGLILGCAVPTRLRLRAEQTLALLLVVALIGSLLIYFLAPRYNLVANDGTAGQYTGEYRGIVRLQALFPGPFHVAMAACVVVGWSLVRYRQHRLLSSISLTVALVAMYFTYVRTAYISLGLVIVGLICSSRTVGLGLRRLSVVVVGASVVVLSMANLAPNVLAVVSSIEGFTTDRRFLNRIPGYFEGFRLFEMSPLFGWGSGSAGDVLGAYFVNGRHITAHNFLLKIVVEGGLVGLGLWLLLAIVVMKGLEGGTDRTRVALCSVLSMLGLGLTGSAIDALPVTFFVFALIGLAMKRPLATGPALEAPTSDPRESNGVAG